MTLEGAVILALNSAGPNRTFGIDSVGNISWGTHLCQFYKTKKDLTDILVPYFAEGLRNNEFCIWITAPPVEAEEAKQTLSKAVPNLEEYLHKEQIEIITYNDWDRKNGKFDINQVLQRLIEKEQQAQKHGFAGLRLSRNTFWVKQDLWKQFVDYEEALNEVVRSHKMIALCTYCIDKCTGSEVLDVIRNHKGTMLKLGEKWTVIEDVFHRKQTEEALKAREQAYNSLFANIMDGFAYHQMVFDEQGKPVDYIFLEVNHAFEELTGLKRKEILGKPVTEVLKGIENDPADWIGRYGKVALTGEPTRFENYNQALGSWFSVSAFSPKKGYFIATFENVTERKKAQEALKESQTRLSAIVDSIADGFYALNSELQFTHVNDTALRHFNKTRKEVIGHTVEEVFPQTEGSVFEQNLQQAVSSGCPIHFEMPSLLFEKIMEVHIYPGANSVTLLFRDVTEQKKAQQKSAWLASFPQLNRNPVLEVDFDCNVQYANPATKNTFPDLETAKAEHPFFADWIQVVKTIQSNKKNTIEREIKIENHWFYQQLTLLSDVKRIRIYAVRIDDLKIAENALREGLKRERFLANLIRYASVAVGVCYPDGRLGMCNMAFQRLTGYTEKELKNMQWNTVLTPPEWIERENQKLQELEQTGKAVQYEKEYIRKDGSRVPIELVVHPSFDENGKVSHYFTFIRNISERKKVENALRDSEQRWSATVSSIGDAVITTDLAGKVTFLNSLAEELTGWTLPEAYNKPIKKVFKIINEQTRKEVESPVMRALKEGAIVGLANHTILINRNGSEIPIDDSGAPIKDRNGNMTGVVLVFRDISERKKSEQILQERNQRLNLFSATATQLLANDDTQQTVENLCKNVMLFLNCDVFFNYVVGKEKGKLQLNAYGGVPKKTAQAIKWLNFGQAVCGTVAQLGQRMVCQNIAITGNEKTALVQSFGIQAYACHPLLAQGKVIGTLSFGSKSKATFTNEELEVMRTVADQVAIAMVRKRQEEAIERAKVEWERTFNTVPDMIAIVDDKHRIIRTNQAMSKRLKALSKECGLICYECIHGTKEPVENCPHSLTLKDGKEHTAEVYEPNLGGYFIVSTTPLKDEDGKLIGSVHVARNITQRKLAEEKLNQLNRTLRAISNSNQALMRAKNEEEFLNQGCEILVKDCGYKMVWIGFARNDKAKSVEPVAYAGFDKGYIDALNVTWADTERGQGPTGRVIRTGKPQFCQDMKEDPNFEPWRKEALKRGYTSSTVLPLKTGNKTFGAIAMYSCDKKSCTKEELRVLTELANDFSYGIITLRLRKEKEQADELMRKQASLIDLSPDAIIIKKPDGTITFWSAGAQKLYGWTNSQAVGKYTHTLLDTKCPESSDDVLRELKETGKWAGELQHRTKDGQIRIVQSYWLATLNETGEIAEIMESNVDVTDRKEMQNKLEEYTAHLEKLVQDRTQQLKDAERLAAIGETAGMVGHDLRNPLQAVTGETYLAKVELNSMPDSLAKKSLEENVDNIVEQIGYMNKIVSDLQDFVKPITPEKKEMNLPQLIMDTLKEVKMPANVKAQTLLAANAQTVLADYQRLKRVFFNLFNNAVQAMPEGGTLTIKTAQKSLKGKKTIVVTVEDTGDGIPDHVKGKIFRPLFTTKSKGQGFGLAVCKRVIETHGGTISFESEAGKGTRFIVELPKR